MLCIGAKTCSLNLSHLGTFSNLEKCNNSCAPYSRQIERKSSLVLQVLSSLKRDLLWWLSKYQLNRRASLLPQLKSILTTDTFLSGSGPHLKGRLLQGRWTPEESTLNINLLELNHLATSDQVQTSSMSQTFPGEERQCVSKGICESQGQVEVSQPNKGGNSSTTLGRVKPSFHKHTISCRKENVEADLVSWKCLLEAEWMLPPQVFHEIAF